MYETPFIVKLFNPYVRTWNQGSGVIYIKPKKTAFQHMFFRSKRFGLMETKWMVTAVYEAISAEKMDERSENVYRAMKGMECSMESSGFIRRRYEFKPNKLLPVLKTLVPEMSISDELARELNEDEGMMQIIRKVRPDDLEIALHSIPVEYQPFVSNKEIAAKAMAEYYMKPTTLSWSVTLGKAIGQGIGASRSAEDIMRLLNGITTIIEKKLEAISQSHMTPTGGVTEQREG